MSTNSTYLMTVSKKHILSQKNFIDYVTEDEKKHSTLKKISDFIQMKQISIKDFWKSDRSYASPDDINTFCINTGLKLENIDQIYLKNQLFLNQQVISIYDFCQKVQFWKMNCKQMIFSLMKEKSQALIDQKYEKNKIKIKTNGNLISNSSTIRGKSLSHSQHSSKQLKIFPFNKSKKYLNVYQKKQQTQECQLANLIDNNKRETQYIVLGQIAQINQICETIQNGQVYKMLKNNLGQLKIKVYKGNNQIKCLKAIHLQKQIKNLKEKENQHKLKKQKQFLINTTYSFGQNINSNPQSCHKDAKIDRQQELKSLLVNTVNLTNLLKQQLNILMKKGVYGCNDI